MLIAATAFFLGLCSYLWWPATAEAVERAWQWSASGVVATLACAALALAFIYPSLKKRGDALRSVHWRGQLLCGLAFAVGALVAAHALGNYRAGLLPEVWEKRDFVLRGQIDGLPQATDFGFRFNLNVMSTQANAVDSASNLAALKRIRLNWYRRDSAKKSVMPVPRAGEVWQFRVRLKRPHGFLNPGGFDYQRWLVSKGIQGKGYIRGGAQRIATARAGGRERLWQSLAAFDGQAAALSAALVLGIRDRLDDTLEQAFIDTGTAHLLAISGLHVGMVAAMGFWLSKAAVYLLALFVLALRRRRPRGRLFQRVSHAFDRFSPIYFYWIGAWLSAAAYASLAGWTLPTQRAFTMLSLFVLAQCLRRSASSLNAWAAALVLLLLMQPLSVFSAGLWLSFAAVAWILLILSRFPMHWPRWKKALLLQCLLPLCLWPITQLWFGQGAVLGALSNVVLIPLTAVLILPSAFALSVLSLLWPDAASSLMPLADSGLMGLQRVMVWLAEQPLTHHSQAGVNWQTAALASALLAFLLFPWAGWNRPVVPRVVALLALLPLLFGSTDRPQQASYRVSLLDVGQGLSTVVQTQHHTLVFDLGPRFPSGFNTAEAVLLPWLNYRGINKIDRLIISHGDSDHSGSLDGLLDAMAVSDIYSGEVERLGAVGVEPCQSGQSWHWDGVQFEVLWPPPNEAVVAGNNRSCVLRVSSPQGVTLMTGDIEDAVERRLLQRESLSADLLIVPHHGSASSSSKRWVEAVDARVAWVSAGYLNRFGLPAQSVVARYQQQGSRVLNSADCGELSWAGFGGQGLGVRCYRRSQGQHWRWRLGSGF